MCKKYKILRVRRPYPDVDFGDGSPADSNLGSKQTNGAAAAGSSVCPPTDDRKAIKIWQMIKS